MPFESKIINYLLFIKYYCDNYKQFIDLMLQGKYSSTLKYAYKNNSLVQNINFKTNCLLNLEDIIITI